MKYKVINKTLKLHGGVVVLSKQQAALRAHNLNLAPGKDRYEIVNPIEFKIGEVLGIEGDVPKSSAANLTETGNDSGKKDAAKAKADKAREKLEAEARAQWGALPELRDEHAGDFAAYLAFVLEQAG